MPKQSHTKRKKTKLIFYYIFYMKTIKSTFKGYDTFKDLTIPINSLIKNIINIHRNNHRRKAKIKIFFI